MSVPYKSIYNIDCFIISLLYQVAQSFPFLLKISKTFIMVIVDVFCYKCVDGQLDVTPYRI
jgi:hypothetical protein